MTATPPPEPETFSLFGDPLNKALLRPETQETQMKLYNEALADYEKAPDDADNIIWMGRRTAYIGDFRKAIAIFSMGIEKHPDDPRMYRHRGHRFITLRYLDRAVNDFEKAAELIRGTEDEVEPDGMPNDRRVPVSSLHFNIWYHLGLAYYCLGEMNKALYAYEKCWEASEIDDKYISTGHWYYMTLRRLGRDARAEKLLESFSGDMDIIENQHYYNCMMMYRGEMTVDDLMGKARELGALGLVTIGYGVANWHNYNGEEDKAVSIYREILALEGWGGFGYIAAEADMYHLGIKP